MSVATKVARVADRLRARGFTVIEVSGWQTRGIGTVTPRGHLNHHTAGPRSGDTPSLRVCTFGRAGLRNALCMWYVSRSGIIYLVAARRSWHAGAGRLGSNSTLAGTEAENTGVGEPWTPRSLDAQAAINAEMGVEFGFDEGRCWDHKEHAPGRKIDRALINPAVWRRDHVRPLLTAPPAAPPEEDDDMIYHRDDPRGTRDARQYVRSFQFALNRFFTDTGGEPSTGWLVKDGIAGDQTFAAAWEAVLRLSAPEPGFAHTAQIDLRANGITSPDVLRAEGIDPVLVAAIVGAAAIR